jgi:hypothetical protein
VVNILLELNDPFTIAARRNRNPGRTNHFLRFCDVATREILFFGFIWLYLPLFGLICLYWDWAARRDAKPALPANWMSFCVPMDWF